MVAISSAVLTWARSQPDLLALVFAEQHITYKNLANRIQHTAGILHDLGINKGDTVALLMKNSVAFVELMLAISHIGAISLPINYRLSADEVEYIVDHANAQLICVDSIFVHNACGAPILEVSSAAQQDSRLLGKPTTIIEHPCHLEPQDTFRLMYTSGTTDRPKGVVHSYNNYYWKCLDHICVLGLAQDNKLLITGPLYHVGAFDLPGMAMLLVGGSIVILPEFDPEHVLSAIQTEDITGIWLAPIMLNRLLSFPQRDTYDTSSLKWAIGGGERTPIERIQAFQTLFSNGRYIDAYGLTETCSGDTMMEAGQELRKIGSAGRALPHVCLEICDENGQSLPNGQIGEICVSGPKVTLGYWRDVERTQASFFDHRFRSGDMGYLDDEGYLFLVDRKKDMVLSGGENIASSEVERVLYQIEGVQEAAVIGIPDPIWGERVVAVLVMDNEQTLSMNDIQAHCEGKLAKFKIPKQLLLTGSLPRNPSGKVLKRVLRDQLSKVTTTT
ncbi:AMP-binding protein [Alcaligenaceae bacterium]|nr:AMP-binding protein [Alcaligenaceae bacterium]